jgi:hypothetical protein
MELYFVIKSAMFGAFTEEERNRVMRQAKIFAALRQHPEAAVVAELHRELGGSLSYTFSFLNPVAPMAMLSDHLSEAEVSRK